MLQSGLYKTSMMCVVPASADRGRWQISAIVKNALTLAQAHTGNAPLKAACVKCNVVHIAHYCNDVRGETKLACHEATKLCAVTILSSRTINMVYCCCFSLSPSYSERLTFGGGALELCSGIQLPSAMPHGDTVLLAPIPAPAPRFLLCNKIHQFLRGTTQLT